MSGKRGTGGDREETGGDREETVVLGVPAKVTVTLVVSIIPDTVPDVGVCRDPRGEGGDPGR